MAHFSGQQRRHTQPMGDKEETSMEKGPETRVEEKDDSALVHPPMTFKRFMVLLSLIWLVVTSATPILFITAALCTLSFQSVPSSCPND